MNAATPELGSLQPRALYEVIADHLRERILQHDLAAGTALDEAELARHYGVSRTPVREAVKVLTFEGLLESPMRRAVTVRAVDPTLHDEALALQALLQSHAERNGPLSPRAGALLPILVNLVEQRLRHTRPRRVSSSPAS